MRFVIFVAAVLAAHPFTSPRACSCIGPSHEQAIRGAAAILAVHIQDIQLDSEESYLYDVSMDVLAVWRGEFPEALVMRVPHSAACGYPFEKGRQYLAYMHKDDLKNMRVELCSGTGRLDHLYFDRYLLGEPIARYDAALETITLETLLAHVGREGDVGATVAWQFKHFEIESALLLPTLIRMARHDIPGNQLAAVRAIGSLGESAAEAYDHLAQISHSWARTDSILRLETFKSMANVGRKDARFPAAHLQAFRDPDPRMRVAAVHAVSTPVGEAASEVRAALLASLDDPDARVRLAAVRRFMQGVPVRRVTQRIQRMERSDPSMEVRDQAGEFSELLKQRSRASAKPLRSR